MLGARHRAAEGGKDGIEKAFAALLGTSEAFSDLSVEVTGELPPGVGLGFSAAAGVAIARAVGALGDDVLQQRVRSRAMAWEQVFHGNPSGVDVAAAMSGGCSRFTRAEGAQPVALGDPLSLCVGLSGTRSATSAMVAQVAGLADREPEVVARSVSRVASIVDQGVMAVEQGDMTALGALMDQNQAVLSKLDVSTATLVDLCRCARGSGALGAKLTGAGGGGAVVALAGTGTEGRQVGEQVVAAWSEQGWEGFVTEIVQAPPVGGEAAP